MATPEDKARELTNKKNELETAGISTTMRDSLRALKDQNDQQQKADKALIAKQKDAVKAETYWSAMQEKTKRFKDKSGQNSYVEWSTGMMDIFAATYDMSKALQHSPSRFQLSDEAFIKRKSKQLGNNLHQLGHALGNYIKDKVEKGAGKIGIEYSNQSHKIAYNISVNKDGHLKTELYLNNKPIYEDKHDDKPLSQEEQAERGTEKELKQYFDAGIWLWLESRGFKATPNNDGKLVITKTNAQGQEEPMTPEMLKEINQDDAQGLRAFFSGHYKLKLDDPEPSSSFTPSA